MSRSQISLAVPGAQTLKPYQPGKPIEEVERELGISSSLKLASNENPLGPSKLAMAAASEALSTSAFYPDATAFRLKNRLQQEFDIPAEQLTVGNGSNELIELIGRVFLEPGDEVMFSEYAFIVYPIVAQACCASSKVVAAKNFGHDLDAMSLAVSQKTKLVYLANPNNPTGTAFDSKEFESFMKAVPQSTLVVLDEAYTEYINDATVPDGLSLVPNYPNLIVLRTFSKAWGLAGLRAGFAFASNEITDLLNRVRQPFNLNSVALAAAEAVLDDKDYLAQSIRINTEGMKQFENGLASLNLNYIPSRANFVTIDFCEAADGYYERLLKQGIIVRPLGIYGMPNHLRVSIGKFEQNRLALDALSRVIQP